MAAVLRHHQGHANGWGGTQCLKLLILDTSQGGAGAVANSLGGITDTVNWQYQIPSLIIHTSILHVYKEWNSWFTIFPLTSINLLALILMYWIWVVILFSCVNLLSQIVHCIYHNVHFVWNVGENEICFVCFLFFEYIHPSSGILYEYEQWIWLFILYFYSIVFWPFLVLPIFFLTI